MSSHADSTWSRHAARSAGPMTLRQPAGTAVGAGQREYCSSSLTRTRSLPSGSSKGWVMGAPFWGCVAVRTAGGRAGQPLGMPLRSGLRETGRECMPCRIVE
ncbi:hypothetical protein STANM309S_03496 [Streptomyces tanashiensis]